MNKWLGIGRLCNEPEMIYTQSGAAIAKYRLAVNRDFKKEGQPEADFLNCISFGKAAEFAKTYLHKGMKVAVEGHIQTGSYDKDGVRHYTTDIIVDRHEFCERRDAQENTYQQQERQAIQQENGGFTAVETDDLPF